MYIPNRSCVLHIFHVSNTFFTTKVNTDSLHTVKFSINKVTKPRKALKFICNSIFFTMLSLAKIFTLCSILNLQIHQLTSKRTTSTEYARLLNACTLVVDTKENCVDMIYQLQQCEYTKNFYQQIASRFWVKLDEKSVEEEKQFGENESRGQQSGKANVVGLGEKRVLTGLNQDKRSGYGKLPFLTNNFESYRVNLFDKMKQFIGKF